MKLQLVLLNLILITHWQLGRVWLWIVIGVFLVTVTIKALMTKV